MELLAWAGVSWEEPSAHSTPLKRPMKSRGKSDIGATVADEDSLSVFILGGLNSKLNFKAWLQISLDVDTVRDRASGSDIDASLNPANSW